VVTVSDGVFIREDGRTGALADAVIMHGNFAGGRPTAIMALPSTSFVEHLSTVPLEQHNVLIF